MIPIIYNSTSISNDDCLDHHELQFNQNIVLMVHMSLLSPSPYLAFNQQLWISSYIFIHLERTKVIHTWR